MEKLGTKISHSLGNFRASFTRLEKFFWHVTCMGKIFFGILVLAKIMPRSVLVLGNFRANLLVSSETNPFGVKKWSIIDHFSSAFFAFCGHFLTILELFSIIFDYFSIVYRIMHLRANIVLLEWNFFAYIKNALALALPLALVCHSLVYSKSVYWSL